MTESKRFRALAWDGNDRCLLSPEGSWETIRQRTDPVVVALGCRDNTSGQVMTLSEALSLSPWYSVEVLDEVTPTRWLEWNRNHTSILAEIDRWLTARGPDTDRSSPWEFSSEPTPDASDLPLWPICWNGESRCILALEGPWESMEPQKRPIGLLIDRRKGGFECLPNLLTVTTRHAPWYRFHAPRDVVRQWAREVKEPDRLIHEVRRALSARQEALERAGG